MYNNFAYIYDKLMYDVNYSAWADYMEKIFHRYDLRPELVLDLGCGTGSLCIELAKRKYDMIGIDLSYDMLSCAREKSVQEEQNILFLNQDMTEFELYGTVDAILCLMDSVNYITKKNDIKKIFKLVRNYLNPGGLFIFDINTKYKLEQVLGSNVFYDVGDDITYIWQNRYNKNTGICEFDLTFFVKEGAKYARYEELHEERAYSIDEIKEFIKGSELELLGVFNNLSFKPSLNNSERLFFVCRKGD